jgi:adenine C2-methylase RlmN of 23S rRNA A2503 and tRNA A37
MPVNRNYNQVTLLVARGRDLAEKRRSRLEYILIGDMHKSDRRTRSRTRVPSLGTRQEPFQSILREHGVVSTLRREKGHDIAAACGQLRLQAKRQAETAEPFVPTGAG